MEMIKFDELKKAIKYRERKMKIEETKRKIKTSLKNGLQWCHDNQTLVLIAVPMIYGLGKGMYKLGNKAIKTRSEMIGEWDPRAGRWWELKRKLKSDEALELNRRYQLGESKGDILESMRLLK